MTEKLCGNCPYNPVEQMIRGGDETCPDAFKEQAKYCNYNYNCQKHSRRLIDAEALIAALLEARREETETTLKLIRFIRKQPTIEPTEVGTQMSLPKRGRWIEKKDFIYCSECGDGFDVIYKIDYRFCPNCGADMRGEA